MRWLWVGLGGFIGAVLRYLVTGWVHRKLPALFPYGTLTVNVLGSFVLGLIMGMGVNWVFSPQWRVFLTLGVLGAFTTFSTFSYETVALIQEGSHWLALVNVALSVLLGLAGAWIGLIVARGI